MSKPNILTREVSVKIMSEYGQGAAWTRHCVAVADAAAKVGDVLAKVRPLDLSFLWSAALLHDIGRHVTHDPCLHGVEGYKLLSLLGHEREAHVCASHILFGLDAADARHLGLPGREFVPRTLEEKLVPLIDYLVEFDRPTTLDRRFSSLRRRNEEYPFFLSRLDRAEEHARLFLTQIEQESGESIQKIVASR